MSGGRADLISFVYSEKIHTAESFYHFSVSTEKLIRLLLLKGVNPSHDHKMIRLGL